MRHATFLLRLLASLVAILSLASCGSHRPITPVGEVPRSAPPSAQDEEYGQEVFRELARQYQIDQNDTRINRVRAIVDRLTAAAGVDRDPWNVYVLVDPSFSNAAATRGNFIFVWTGLLDEIKNDDELAAILGHELAHVLAGHTAPDPAEEVNIILSGTAGNIAGQIVAQTTGPYGVFADFAALAVREAFAAFLVNPAQQEKEFEADQIGIFVMAKAGYDPRSALDFWERVKDKPGYRGAALPVLSSHPSSEERLERLKEITPQALERYRLGNDSTPLTSKQSPVPGNSSDSEWVWNAKAPVPPQNNPLPRNDHYRRDQPRSDTYALPDRSGKNAPPPGSREVAEIVRSTSVYSAPDTRSPSLQRLAPGIHVVIIERTAEAAPRGSWVLIDNPVRGFIMSKDITSPLP